MAIEPHHLQEAAAALRPMVLQLLQLVEDKDPLLASHTISRPELTGDEETLHRQARIVPGVHSLLRQNPPMPTFGVRNATVLFEALRLPCVR